MSSQNVCYTKGSEQNSHSLEVFFFNLFSVASWEEYKAPLKLVGWVLSCPLLMSMSEAFSVTCTVSNIYTKLWVIETVFCPRVNSSPSETTDLATSFTIHCKLSQPTPVFLPGKPNGQRSLAGYSPWGCKNLDMTERLSTRHSLHTNLKIWMHVWSIPGLKVWVLGHFTAVHQSSLCSQSYIYCSIQESWGPH